MKTISNRVFVYFMAPTPILAFPLVGGRTLCGIKVFIPSPLRGEG